MGFGRCSPPCAEKLEVAVPDTAPPFDPGIRAKTTLDRVERGAVEIRCGECSPDLKTLVPLDGRMTLGESFRVQKFDFTQREMRVHFDDSRDGRYGTPSAFAADVVTPWTNVALVRRVSTPNRGLGVRLLLSAAIGAVLGGLSLGDGVADGHPTITVFGAIILPLAARARGRRRVVLLRARRRARPLQEPVGRAAGPTKRLGSPGSV